MAFNDSQNSTDKLQAQLLTQCSLGFLNTYKKDIDSMLISSIIFSVLSLITAVCAILGNGVVIVAIWKTPTMHTPSNILLLCLAITDFLTGIVSQPAIAAFLISRMVGSYDSYCRAHMTSFIAGYFLSGTSFFTLTAVSIDRFLALHLHLRYKEIVTVSRVLRAELIFMVLVIVITLMPFYTGFDLFEQTVACIMIFGVIFNMLAYASILRTIMRHQAAIRSELQTCAKFNGESSLPDFKRIRRSSRTMIVIFILFCFCYLPNLSVTTALIFKKSHAMGRRLRTAYEFSIFMVCVNGSLNPAIYCFRIREFRQAVCKLIGRETPDIRMTSVI